MLCLAWWDYRGLSCFCINIGGAIKKKTGSEAIEATKQQRIRFERTSIRSSIGLLSLRDPAPPPVRPSVSEKTVTFIHGTVECECRRAKKEKKRRKNTNCLVDDQ